MPQGEPGQTESNGNDAAPAGRRLPGRHTNAPPPPDGRRGYLDGGPSLHARAEATRQLTTRPPGARPGPAPATLADGADELYAEDVDDRNVGWYDEEGDVDVATSGRQPRRGSRPTGRRAGRDNRAGRDRGRRDERNPRRERDDRAGDQRPGLLAGLGDALTRERGQAPARRGPSDATMARIGATVLWVLVIVAAYGGVTAWLRSGTPGSATAAPAATENADGRWAAAGFAERYLAAYLEAGPDGALLAPYLGYTPDLPPTSRPAEVTTPLRTVEVRPGDEDRSAYWSVTLAVGIPDTPPSPAPEELGATEATDDESGEDTGGESAGDGDGQSPDGPPGEQFWQVAVDTSGPQPVAVGLPAPVPPPAEPDQAEGTYTLRLPPQDDPMVESTEGFLAAYLCGAPDLDRYLHPDYQGADAAGGGGTGDAAGDDGNDGDGEQGGLQPADPPVCDSVTVERWATGEVDPGPGDDAAADGARHTVLAEVTFDDGEDARRATYGLTLARRDGRWEVAALLAAPPREER